MAHTIQGDLNLVRALLLNNDAGAAGKWPVSTAGGAMEWWAVSDIVSEDGDNDLGLDGSGKLKLAETVTSLAYNSGTTTLTFTDEDGGVTNIDLAALTTDIYVNGASLSGDTLILTDNDGETPNVVVDLSSFRGSVTVNGNGTFTFDDGSGSLVDVDMRTGVSTDPGNDLTNGTDFRPFFSETVTGLTLSGSSLVYDRESGADQTIQLVSSTVKNRLAAGDSGGLFVEEIRSKASFNATTDWGSASGGLYTLTISAASFSNAHADAVFQVQKGVTAPFETAIGMHSALLNADGSVTLQVCATPDGRFAGRVAYIG